MLALTVDVPSNVLDGINAAEAAAAPLNAVEVTAGSGEIVIVTFTGANGAVIDKPLVATGSKQSIALDAGDFGKLTDGPLSVSVRNYTTPETKGVGPINLDRVGPGSPVLALGPGVSDGASRAEATQPAGIVTVQGDVGGQIVVTFAKGAGEVIKPITGTGQPQPVTLTLNDLATLGDGMITVSATQADAVGNPQVGLPASRSLALDATPPAAPTITVDPLVGAGGITLAEALVGFVDLSATREPGDAAQVVVSFTATRASGAPTRTVTKNFSFDNGAVDRRFGLTEAEFLTLGEGDVSVSASLRDLAGNTTASAPYTFALVAGPARPQVSGLVDGQAINAARAGLDEGLVTVSGAAGNVFEIVISNGDTEIERAGAFAEGSTSYSVVLTPAEVASLADGPLSITAVQSDGLNNSPAATLNLLFDNAEPEVPKLPTSTNPTVNISAARNGNTVKVRGELGATITVVFRGGPGIGDTVSASVIGQGPDVDVPVMLSLNQMAILPSGLIQVTASQSDAAGNQSDPAGPWVFTLDKTAPARPAIALFDTDGSVLQSGADLTEATVSAANFIRVTGLTAGNQVIVRLVRNLIDGTPENPTRTRTVTHIIANQTVTTGDNGELRLGLSDGVIKVLGSEFVDLKVEQYNPTGNGSPTAEIPGAFRLGTRVTSDEALIQITEDILPKTGRGGATEAELLAGNIRVRATAGNLVEVRFQRADGSSPFPGTSPFPLISGVGTGSPEPVTLTAEQIRTLVGGERGVRDIVVFARQRSPQATVAWGPWEQASFTIDTVPPDMAPDVTPAVTGTISRDGAKGVLLTFNPPSGPGVDPASWWNGLQLTLVGAKGGILPPKYVQGTGGTNQSISIPLTNAELAQLGDGTLTIYARTRDAAGNVQAVGSATIVTLVLDVTAPSKPVLNYATGVSATKPLTALQAKGALVTVFGDQAYGNITLTYTSPNGSVSLTATKSGNAPNATWAVPQLTDAQLQALGVGEVTVTATQADNVGNVSEPSSPLTFTIVAPSRPTFRYAPGISPDGKVSAAQAIAGAITIQGTAAPELRFEITLVNDATNESLTLLIPVDGNGTRQLVRLTTQQIQDLVVGKYDLTAVQIDSAGNRSEPHTTVLDIQAPAPPMLRFVPGVSPTEAASLQEMISGAVTVQGETGLAITVTFENPATGVSVPRPISANGQPQAVTLTSQQVASLGDGSITVTAFQTDAVAQKSTPVTLTFLLDPTPPALVITSVTDDASPVTGGIADSGVTNDTTPTFAGTVEAGASLTVSVNSGVAVSVPVASGNWTYTPPAPLPNGTHSFSFVATDAAGNENTVTFNLTVKTTAQVPVITSVTDNVSPVTGGIADGGVTNDATPTFDGTAEADATLAVSINGGSPVPVPVTNGSWTYTSPVLPTGTNTFSFVATDAAGNVSAPTTFTLTVDTDAPLPPVITSVTDNVSPVIASIAAGGVTNDTTPTFAGTVEPGASLTVSINGSAPVAVSVSGSSWTYTPLALPVGPHTFSFVATDAAGNVSTATQFTLTVKTTAQAPVITSVTDNVAPLTGGIADGGVTNDTTPTFTGTVEPGATLTVAMNGGAPVAVPVSSGNWTYTPLTLAIGTHTFSFVATDAAGNVSTATQFTLTVKTTAQAPVITSVADNVVPLTGGIADGGVTNDTTPTFTGIVEAGATLTVAINSGGPIPVTVNGGAWTYTPSALPVGLHTFSFVATDAAGNVSTATQFSLTVKTTAQAPVIASVTDNVAPVTGGIDDGGVTNDTTPTFTGTVEAGASLAVSINGGAAVAVPVSGGNWTYTSPVLPTGIHTFSFVATDVAGNVSTPTLFKLIVDTVALPPVITSVTDNVSPVTGGIADGGVTNDATPTFAGTVEAGATLAVSINGGSPVPVPVTNGSWTYTPSLPNGTRTFSFVATDAAGNVSAPTTFTLTVDTVAAPPAITLVTDNVSPVTGGIADGGVTNDTTPTFTGTVEAGATLAVSVNGGAAVAVSVSGSNWTYTPPALPNGTYTFSFVATDAAGNVSDPATFTLSVKTAALPPVIASVIDNVPPVTGGIVNGGVTNDTTPTFAGTVEAGATLAVSINGGAAVAVPVSGSNWTYTPAPLPNGTHTFSFVAADAAGNENTVTFTLTVKTAALPPVIASVIDNVPPVTDGIAAGGVTNDTTPTFTGTVEAGATLAVSINGGAPVAVPVSSGTWTYTPALPTGTHTLSFVATDAAGNVSTATPFSLTVKTTALPPVITSVTDNAAPVTGGIAPAGVTNDTTPTFTGTVEAGASLAVSINGGVAVPVPVSSGSWTYTPAALTNGTHTFSFVATDAAGNVSAPATFTLTVDTVAAFPTGVLATSPSGTYVMGQSIDIQVTFSKPVTVTGGLALQLNTMPLRSAMYVSGSGTSVLTFRYDVQLGDWAARLDYASASALSGGTILGATGIPATLTLPQAGGFLGKNIVVDALIKATVAGLSQWPSNPPDYATSLSSFQVQFNMPVTGFDLGSISLQRLSDPLNPDSGRVISLLRVSVSGSGTNWTITLPSSTNPTSLPGRYKLVIGGPSSGIESGGILMDVASEWYFDRI